MTKLELAELLKMDVSENYCRGRLKQIEEAPETLANRVQRLELILNLLLKAVD